MADKIFVSQLSIQHPESKHRTPSKIICDSLTDLATPGVTGACPCMATITPHLDFHNLLYTGSYMKIVQLHIKMCRGLMDIYHQTVDYMICGWGPCTAAIILISFDQTLIYIFLNHSVQYSSYTT